MSDADGRGLRGSGNGSSTDPEQAPDDLRRTPSDPSARAAQDVAGSGADGPAAAGEASSADGGAAAEDTTDPGPSPAPPDAAEESTDDAHTEPPPTAGSDERFASADEGPLRVRYAGSTVVGLVRDHNEDTFVVADLTRGERATPEHNGMTLVDDRGVLLAVCDGMGGAAAGEVASGLAADIMYEVMREGGPPPERDALARRLVESVQRAGKRIFATAQQDRTRRGMGTTVTAAALLDRVLFVAQVGDSRAYLLRQGELRQLTKDQSLVNQLIEAGHLTEEEAEAFEHSNIILQALGTSEAVQVDLTFVELRRSDRVLVCSDGLSGLVHADVMRDVMEQISDPAECCRRLIDMANEAGGHDNITAVIADFEGEPLPLPQPEDSFGYMQYPLVEHETQQTPRGKAVARSSRPPSARPAVSEPSSRGGGYGWLIAGALTLVITVVGMELVKPSEEGSEPTQAEAHEVRPAEPAASAEPPEPEPDSAVTVNVRTDVDDAVLVVNGEDRGALPEGQERSIQLAPGAYRLEARSDGTAAAVSVVTVQADTPLDVHLSMPSGATEPAAGRRAARADDEERPRQAVRRRAEPQGEQEVAAVERGSTRHVRADTEQPAASDQPSSSESPAEQERAEAPQPDEPAAGTESAREGAGGEPAEEGSAGSPSSSAPPRVARSEPPAESTPSEPAPAPPPPQDIPENPF